jgi:hypothetical protein
MIWTEDVPLGWSWSHTSERNEMVEHPNTT